MILDELKDWFFELIYKLQSGICYLIDFIKEVFFKLCGLDTVKVNGEDKDLVASLVQSNTIHRVFLTVFLIGVILLVIFLIIALIRANYQGNEKKSRGAIMAKAGQSFLICLLVPFLLLAGMTLVSTIMGSLNNAMQLHITDSPSKLGGQMLITSGYNAFKGSAESRAAIETMFLTGELDYNNLGHVRMFYNIYDINYVIGIFGGLVMLIMFAISSITFIQRIFDIILLYRTTLEKFDMQKVMNGNSELVIDFTSGWSLGDCFVDVYPNKGAGKCPNLEDICKELGVTILAAVGEEPMEGFREKIRYIKGQPFFYQKSDTPYHLNVQDWEEWKSNMEMEAQ